MRSLARPGAQSITSPITSILSIDLSFLFSSLPLTKKSYPIGTIPPTVPESSGSTAAAAAVSAAAAAVATPSSAAGVKTETEIAQHVLLQVVPKCSCVFFCLPRVDEGRTDRRTQRLPEEQGRLVTSLVLGRSNSNDDFSTL